MPTKVETKTCTKCKVEKSFSEFYREAQGKFGIRSQCIDCMIGPGRHLPPGPRPIPWTRRYREDSETGCWIWTGARGKHGYGMIKFGGKSVMAHRHVYEQVVGPIPDGLIIDHLCNVKICVNPEHLEPVTQKTNTQRAWDGRHCPGCRCMEGSQ